ncbi:hypothetical protein A1QO_19000 [Vibrio genomosp. F10 str. ZF-129]|uniref:Uncharacterized protein n=1 Tax=Vibrio genomosp. F10 str. ZF-129 TaxID=1187848 RepID=A0A1E5BHS3_9VIBR|nr:hypothetical protein [Vibrio genomosp. F10]OEE36486.1 hypothetical protein A1QO_19000 [Vibrio genomosp. F10 str. ZF-129]
MIPNYDPREIWFSKTWTLDSDDLFDRFGFSDGALFEDLALAEHMNMPNQQEILKLAVEHLLLPKIEYVIELYDWNTSHNRVRFDDRHKGTFERVEITVTGEQVFQVLDKHWI